MRLRELSIIQYQNISNTPQVHNLWLPLDAFKRQLAFFSNNHFNVFSLDESIGYMEGKIRRKGIRPIALTFDNGFMDFYDLVYPAVLEYDYPCTVLISPEKVGGQIPIGNRMVRYLTWDQLRELIRNKMTVGAYEDYDLSLNRIPEDLLLRHLEEYKKRLEDNLSSEIRYFGIKEGIPNDRVRDHLISEGYKAFLTQCPTNQRPDLYAIGRIQVDDDDFNIFLTKVSRTYLFFKDKRTWKYIRKYHLDKAAHRISEAWDGLRGAKSAN